MRLVVALAFALVGYWVYSIIPKHVSKDATAVIVTPQVGVKWVATPKGPMPHADTKIKTQPTTSTTSIVLEGTLAPSFDQNQKFSPPEIKSKAEVQKRQ